MQIESSFNRKIEELSKCVNIRSLVNKSNGLRVMNRQIRQIKFAFFFLLKSRNRNKGKGK